MAQKLFRDPVYDYITIDTQKYPWLLDLLNTAEVQRLRFISQLGLSQFTYPGSNHSRFSHSLGVLHLMKECVSYLKREHPEKFAQLDEEALLAASLLHDIGHSPFSHATEKFFGNHEERAVKIILNRSSNIHKILRRVSDKLPRKVADLISEIPLLGTKLWQKSLISSQLDMDRLDYLRRDSLCSGAEYGNFDCFRIIHTMELREGNIGGGKKDTWITWPKKSMYVLEEYIFSRFYMYQSVYFHHTTRGFECLVAKILERAKELASENKRFRNQLIEPLNTFLSNSSNSNWVEFSKLTDNILFAQISVWKSSTDKILSDLSSRLLDRKGLARYEVPKNLSDFEVADKIAEVRDYLKKKGLMQKYYFFEDETGTSVYKPYRSAIDTQEQSSVTSIMLYDKSSTGTGFYEISNHPDLKRLKAITQDEPLITKRYYFPKEHENKIRGLLK